MSDLDKHNIEYFSEHVLSRINKTEPKLNDEGNVIGFKHYIDDLLVIEEFFETKILYFRNHHFIIITEHLLIDILKHFFPNYEINIIYPSFSAGTFTFRII